LTAAQGHPGQLGAPQAGQADLGPGQRDRHERGEADEVPQRLTAQPAFVLRPDERPVEREGHSAGELHHGQDQQAGEQPRPHRRIVAEHVRRERAGRGEQHRQPQRAPQRQAGADRADVAPPPGARHQRARHQQLGRNRQRVECRRGT
jgi:hypothetical protein